MITLVDKGLSLSERSISGIVGASFLRASVSVGKKKKGRSPTLGSPLDSTDFCRLLCLVFHPSALSGVGVGEIDGGLIFPHDAW